MPQRNDARRRGILLRGAKLFREGSFRRRRGRGKADESKGKSRPKAALSAALFLSGDASLLKPLADVVGDALRGGRVQVGEHDDRVAAVEVDVELAVHARRAAAVADDSVTRDVVVLEAVGVLTVRFGAGLRLARDDCFGQLRAEQLVAAQRFTEALQVAHGRVTPARGHPAPGERLPVRGQLPRRPTPHVADGQVRYLVSLREAARELHARAVVDVLLDVVVVALARHLFDDEAEHDEAGVAVRPARARLEPERLVSEEREVVLDLAQLVLPLVELGAEDV